MLSDMFQKARHWFEYMVVRNVVSAATALPWRTGRQLGRAIGSFYYRVDRRRRRVNALSNLAQAFPHKSEDELKTLVKGVYRHLGAALLDSLYFGRFVSNWPAERLYETRGLEKLADLPASTGAIFVTGHFGHWEILGAVASLLGYPVWSVRRPFDNAYLEEYLRSMRGVTGQRMLSKEGFLRQMIRLLEGGQNVAVLIDQDARRHGDFVDFFGRPASTTTAPARMAVRTGAPVVFAYARRIGEQNRFRIVLSDVVRPRADADRQSEIQRITQRLTSDLECVVRRHPEEWLWLHRRWKTYPGKYSRRED